MERTFTDAIHLVSSDSAAGHIIQIGMPRKHVRILSDRLTIGPCDVAPERHIALRRAWNTEALSEVPGLDLCMAVAGELPVIIWATRAYADLVWLWWILDGLVRLGPLPLPPILVRPRLDDPLETVGGATPEEALAALAHAHDIDDEEFREGADLWRLYASPGPCAFDEARRRGSQAFPELSESAELYGTWFPRLEDGRLRLSEHDERLLGSLTDEWLMPLDLNKLIIKTRGWERLLWPFGGFVSVWRLRQWAAHGVVAREVRDPDNDNPSVPTSLETVARRYLCTDGRRMVLKTCRNQPQFLVERPPPPLASASSVSPARPVRRRSPCRPRCDANSPHPRSCGW